MELQFDAILPTPPNTSSAEGRRHTSRASVQGRQKNSASIFRLESGKELKKPSGFVRVSLCAYPLDSDGKKLHEGKYSVEITDEYSYDIVKDIFVSAKVKAGASYFLVDNASVQYYVVSGIYLGWNGF